MAPIISIIANLIPGVVNTVGNLIKDKKKAKAETSKLLPAFVKDDFNVADGLELSSKTVFGYGLGGLVITAGLKMIAVPETAKIGAVIIGIGAIIVVGVTIAKALEK